VEAEEFDLLFRSAREFFFAPVIEYGPLPQWKEIAGKGETMQEIFWHIKEAIDAYFGDRAFSVTIKAGCLLGRKPLESERPKVAPKPAPAPAASDDDQITPAVPVSMPPLAPEQEETTPPGGAEEPRPRTEGADEFDDETGEIVEISTNEIQVVDEVIESIGALDDAAAKHDEVLNKK